MGMNNKSGIDFTWHLPCTAKQEIKCHHFNTKEKQNVHRNIYYNFKPKNLPWICLVFVIFKRKALYIMSDLPWGKQINSKGEKILYKTVGKLRCM